MLYQFNHQILSSFYLWFENKLLKSDVKAYGTDYNNLFSYVAQADADGNWLAYQGQYRQLVAEEQVDKVNSGVFINGSFVSGSSTGIYIDYNDGRVIVPVASGQNLTITANSTVKEVNVYLTNESPESILLYNDFVIQGAETAPYLNTQTNKRDDKTYIVPACFISIESSDSQPFCFGGEDETLIRMRVFVVAPDTYTRDGILSVFTDTERSDFKLIESETSFPYGTFFSLKSFPYNYQSLADSQPSGSSNRAFIKKVTASRANPTRDSTNDFNKTFLFGFLDFDLSTARFPRL